jgi:hypothetical protein
VSDIDYEQLMRAYASTSAQPGDGEPSRAWLSERAYWALAVRFNPGLKLPRKLKKRVLGTRKQRGKRFKFKLRRIEIHVTSRLVDLQIMNTGSEESKL